MKKPCTSMVAYDELATPARPVDKEASRYVFDGVFARSCTARNANRIRQGKQVETRSRTKPSTRALTPRELEVLRLLAGGLRYKVIGAVLGIKAPTVHAHMKNVFSKLAVHTRTAAMATALRDGLVQLDMTPTFGTVANSPDVPQEHRRARGGEREEQLQRKADEEVVQSHAVDLHAGYSGEG